MPISVPVQAAQENTLASHKFSLRWDPLLVLPFLLLYLVQLVHHELWRDELNAWAISAAAPNWKVLYGYLRYEGHPALWYIVLWFVTRFTTSPVALKVVEGTIGIAVYLVIARYAPFPRWQKALLYLSYFISFEYTVPARMYSLMVLFLFFYLHSRTIQPERPERNALLLALMANTDTIGLILSFALAVEYILERSLKTGRNLFQQWPFRRAVLLYTLSVLITVFTLRISPHITWRDRTPLFASARDMSHLVQAIASCVGGPWLPINPEFPKHWWNFYLSEPSRHPAYLAATGVALAAYAIIFGRRWLLLQIILTTTFGAIALNHLVYLGSVRHFGITFLAFLAALWLARQRTAQTHPLAVALLSLSAVAGVVAAYAQWLRPFSQGPATAAFIHAQGLDREVFLSNPDTAGAEVGELLQLPYYALDCACTSRFLLYSNDRDNFFAIMMPEALRTAQHKLHRSEFTVITIYPIVDQLAHDLRQQRFSFQLLRKFTGAEEPQENYYVYQILVPPPPAMPVPAA